MESCALPDDNKVDSGTKHLEIEAVLESAARARATHYQPGTQEEKDLDKKVNRKLDFIVLSLLAIEFIVRVSFFFSLPLPISCPCRLLNHVI